MQNRGFVAIIKNSTKISRFLALFVVSFIFQLAGFVTPGWLVYSGDSYSTHVGLWYTVGCSSGKCKRYGRSRLTVIEYQLETCIALAACIAAIFFTRQANRSFNPSYNRSLLIVAFICGAVSGILALVATGRFVDAFINKMPSLSRSYSLYKTGLGGILASIAPLLALCFYRDCGQPQQSYQSQQPPQEHMVIQQPAYYPPVENAYYPPAGNVTSVADAYPMAPVTPKDAYIYGPPDSTAQPSQ